MGRRGQDPHRSAADAGLLLTRAYFFNNRDYHGVEADPTFRYTLRVDGTFRQDVLDALDIPDGVLRTSPVSGSSAT